MPWNPPTTMPTPPSAPTGKLGIVQWLAHAFKLTRVTAVGWFIAFIGFALVPLIIKIMGGIGIGFVSYTLGNMALTEVFAVIQTNFNQLPPEILPFIGMSKIGEGISIVFGGLAAKLALMGFTSNNATGQRRGMIWEA